MKQDDEKGSFWVIVPLSIFILGFLTLAFVKTMYPDTWLGALVAGRGFVIGVVVLGLISGWILAIKEDEVTAGYRRRSKRSDFGPPKA